MSTPEIFERHGQFDDAYVEELSEQSPDVIWFELSHVIPHFDYAADPLKSEEWIESIMSRMTDELYQYDDEEDDFLDERAKVIYLLSQASGFTSAVCKNYVCGLHKFEVLLQQCQNDTEKLILLNDANMHYVVPIASTLLISDQLLVNLTPVITPAISRFISYTQKHGSHYVAKIEDCRTTYHKLLTRYKCISTKGLCENLHKICLLNSVIGQKSELADMAQQVITQLLGDRTDNLLNIAQLLQLQNSESYWKEAVDNTVQPTVETPHF